LLNLDIHTLIILLVLGNLVSAALMAAMSAGASQQAAHRTFIFGKLAQSLGWFLLSLRGGASDLVTAYIGNSILIAGVGCEAFALTATNQVHPRWRSLYVAVVAIGIPTFWLLARTPGQWVVIASAIVMTLYGAAAAGLLWNRAGSRLRALLGLLYGAYALVLGGRAGTAGLGGTGFMLMSRNWIQGLTFLALFVVMLVGVVGFLLLLKEQEDRQLSESEAKFNRLFQSAPIAMLLTHFADGVVLDVNDRFQELSGYPRSAAIGRTTAELGLFERLDAREGIWQRLREGGQIHGVELTLRTRGGELIEGVLSTEAILIHEEKVILSSLGNITDQKRAERERDRTIQELQDALADIKTLKGMLPICASCKKIRDDNGYWNQLEHYIKEHSDADFTHGICPDCAKDFFPENPGSTEDDR
jgi:PAS domain S-box-containing protein